MVDRDEAVYIISVAAELAGVHPQTLRIYERKGLIRPQRTKGGTRRYSAQDLERLARIQELTSEGVNLEGVRRILALQEENERLKAKVERLRRLLQETDERLGTGPSERTVIEVGEATRPRRRPLPAIRRPFPFWGPRV